MDSQDKRKCVDDEEEEEYYDCFGDILNMLDLPVENLEEDGLAEDWASKLGPIPSHLFRDILPPPPPPPDFLTHSSSLLNDDTCPPKSHPLTTDAFKSQRKPQLQPAFLEGKKAAYPKPRSFEAPSPDSVLESRSSAKAISFGTQMPIPVRSRTKRSRSGSTTNPWSKSTLLIPLQKEKKKRRNLCQQPVNEMKKCSHCEITKTPQWREGPMGPKTLCNACGVRYRSGRLFPEYRPAASPTFIPALHSNSHRKVIEMRQKGDNYVMKKLLSSNSTHTRLSSPE